MHIINNPQDYYNLLSSIGTVLVGGDCKKIETAILEYAQIYQDNYGTDGKGGHIALLSQEHSQKEFNNLLAEYRLEESLYEWRDFYEYYVMTCYIINDDLGIITVMYREKKEGAN